MPERPFPRKADFLPSSIQSSLEDMVACHAVRTDDMLDETSSDGCTVFEEGEALVVRLCRARLVRRRSSRNAQSEGSWDSSPTVHDSTMSSPVFAKIPIPAVSAPSIGLLSSSFKSMSRSQETRPSSIDTASSFEICEDMVGSPASGMQRPGDGALDADEAASRHGSLSMPACGDSPVVSDPDEDKENEDPAFAESDTEVEEVEDDVDSDGPSDLDNDNDNQTGWERAVNYAATDSEFNPKTDFRRRPSAPTSTAQQSSTLSKGLVILTQEGHGIAPPTTPTDSPSPTTSPNNPASDGTPRQVEVEDVVFDMVSPVSRTSYAVFSDDEDAEPTWHPNPNNTPAGDDSDMLWLDGKRRAVLGQEVGRELCARVMYERSLSAVRIFDAVRRRPGYNNEVRAQNTAYSNDYFINCVHDRFHSEGW